MGDGTEDFAYSIKLRTTVPLNIQEDTFPHLNKIHMIWGGQTFLLKNEQIQTDTRTVSLNCDFSLCSCGQSSESTVHFFLHCHLYIDLRRVPLDRVSEIILNDVRVYPDQHVSYSLLW